MRKILFTFVSLFAVISSSNVNAQQSTVKEQTSQDLYLVQSKIKNISQDFNSLFSGPYSLGDVQSETLKDKKIPQLLSNNEILNNNAKVAAFAVKNNAYVAILVKEDKEFIVISSNIKKYNDMSVEGLKIDHANIIYKNLNADLGFHGSVNLWGKTYLAKVDPLKNRKNQVIGAFLVALPINDEPTK